MESLLSLVITNTPKAVISFEVKTNLNLFGCSSVNSSVIKRAMSAECSLLAWLVNNTKYAFSCSTFCFSFLLLKNCLATLAYQLKGKASIGSKPVGFKVMLTTKTQSDYSNRATAKSVVGFGRSNNTGVNNTPILCVFFYVPSMTGGYWDTFGYAVSSVRSTNPIFACHPILVGMLTGFINKTLEATMPTKTLTLDPSVLSVANNQITTNSRKVANVFGKLHKNITQKIEQLDCSAEFLTANFSAVKYKHRGNEYKSYDMTKDGFMFLVMGFTGKKAAQIKEAYINAFNLMATKLQRQTYASKDVVRVIEQQAIDKYQREQAQTDKHEQLKHEKYALLNAMIEHLNLPDDPVVIPAVELVNTVAFVRHIQQRATALQGACGNIDKCVDNLKAVTGRSLLC